MNTVQNGKGDRPRNNSSPQWYQNYEAINWHRDKSKRPPALPEPPASGEAEKPLRGSGKP